MAPLGDQLHYSPKICKLKRNSQSMPACGAAKWIGEAERELIEFRLLPTNFCLLRISMYNPFVAARRTVQNCNYISVHQLYAPSAP